MTCSGSPSIIILLVAWCIMSECDRKEIRSEVVRIKHHSRLFYLEIVNHACVEYLDLKNLILNLNELNHMKFLFRRSVLNSKHCSDQFQTGWTVRSNET